MIQTLEELTGLMRQDGVVRIYAKKLAPNDNSKNQVYLGGDFSALNIIPHGDVETDDTDLAGSVRDRAKAPVRFRWIDENGQYEAPNAQLILYPKYPEVRMSGFLKGCKQAPAEVMRVRDEGRVLFLGMTHDGVVLAYAAGAGTPLANALHARAGLTPAGVFLQIPSEPEGTSSRDRLLATLEAIYRKHWISSRKLGPDGIPYPYTARNGGGYTLEAELGIMPNGYAEPDFLGWEIKQYSVDDFARYKPKSPVTLLTPEPTGGYYRDQGVEAFVRRFGYADKSGKPDRINFGGVYACNKAYHADTGLQMRMTGYDEATGKITDMTGGLALQDIHGEVAALWKFTNIIEHWSRKHAQAAYVPSLFRTPPPEYRYGPRIQLCEETDLTLFLQAVAAGVVYYDPAIKIEKAASAKPELKRRSQFRIRHEQLETMYHQTETVEFDLHEGGAT
ncbi:MvaI/BcnI restriction endonuclease family protein [Ensifer adhaerens]|nr:MvaI/BcnI restriction endonuclease family protein [Ensifer adhaerens]